MVILLKEYVGTYLEYSQIFGKKLNRNKIEEIIKDWNCYPYSVLLSILCFYEMNNKGLNKIFSDNIIKGLPGFNTKEYSDIINKSIICSPQGLLCTWKHILINHQKVDKNISGSLEFCAFQVMLLVIAIQDYLVTQDGIQEDFVIYIIRNLHFISSDSMRNSISRTWLMYFEPEIISNLQNTKEYVDYPKTLFT